MQGAPDDEVVTHLNDHLALIIDLSFPIDTLKKSFEAILKRWNVPHSKKKSGRSHQYDIWEVYELLQGKGTKRPSYADVAEIFEGREAAKARVRTIISESNIKAVERAYRKASKTIQHIESTSHI